MDSNLNITKNLKAIELLKSELVCDTGVLYRKLALGKNFDEVGSAAAKIVADIYLLSSRLGISYAAVDMKIRELSDEIKDEEFSELVKYITTRKV